MFIEEKIVNLIKSYNCNFIREKLNDKDTKIDKRSNSNER